MTYGYDPGDRLTSITQGSAVVAFGYDAADRRTTLTLPNGIVMTSTYDAASRVTELIYSQGSSTLGTLSYAYDADGNRIAVGGTWARTGLPPALASAVYDDANQITSWGGTAFAYDANGNLTNDGAKTYTWNARDELAALSGSVAASFSYDGLGRRRAKTVSGTMTAFLYDGLNAVQELIGGAPSATILSGLDLDEWFTRTDGVGARHFLTDGFASTVGLADDGGAMQTQYTYEPFGVTTVAGASSANALQFTGRENDGTGVLYYRARYYDPVRQRFASEDPAGFTAVEANLYTYVFNNPTAFTDPTGEVAVWLLPLLVRGCVIGAATEVVIDVSIDVLSGRKNVSINWVGAAAGCAAGAAAPFTGPKGPIFGRARYRNGVPGILNRGPIRLGWSWSNSSGRNWFSLHWGAPGSTFPRRGHIPLIPGPRGPRW